MSENKADKRGRVSEAISDQLLKETFLNLDGIVSQSGKKGFKLYTLLRAEFWKFLGAMGVSQKKKQNFPAKILKLKEYGILADAYLDNFSLYVTIQQNAALSTDQKQMQVDVIDRYVAPDQRVEDAIRQLDKLIAATLTHMLHIRCEVNISKAKRFTSSVFNFSKSIIDTSYAKLIKLEEFANSESLKGLMGVLYHLVFIRIASKRIDWLEFLGRRQNSSPPQTKKALEECVTWFISIRNYVGFALLSEIRPLLEQRKSLLSSLLDDTTIETLLSFKEECDFNASEEIVSALIIISLISKMKPSYLDASSLDEVLNSIRNS